MTGAQNLGWRDSEGLVMDGMNSCLFHCSRYEGGLKTANIPLRPF